MEMRRAAMTVALRIAYAVLLVLGGCTNDAANAGDAAAPVADATSQLALADGAWQLRVDRTLRADANIQLPTQALTEQDYEPAAKPLTHDVVVSMQTQHVAIDAAALQGDQTVGASNQQTFDLTTGTFAGGRFVVWHSAGGLSAELTIYGSGRPIAKSERGTLTRVTR